MKQPLYRFAAALAVCVPLVFAQSSGSVYSQTNSTSGNAVVALPRSADGTLGAPAYYPTGGLGTGAGLGSQGSVAVTNDGRWLLAVNAGSNDVSLFEVGAGGGLAPRGRTPSGGVFPISVTVHGDVAFVLNAGGSPHIAGFQISPGGILTPLGGVAAAVHGAAPAQVQFDDHGELLVVTNKATSTIDVFRFTGGAVQFLFTAPSAGQTPFGFAFAHNDVLVVSEAGTGSASSYQLSDSALRTISPAVSDAQAAPCWVAVTNSGKFAYVANTGSNSVSGYSVTPAGVLTLLAPAAGNTPGPAIDLALSRNSTYLYALAAGTISTFRVAADGSLTNLGVAAGMPATLVGLAAR